jgi:threonine dehydratase
MISSEDVSLEVLDDASDYLSGVLLTTPCEYSPALSERVQRDVWLKLEFTQPTRSFKVRGALYKTEVLGREPNRPGGLVTASTGNHGLGVAYAAKVHGYPATVFVPEGSNPAKLRAMRFLGAEVVIVGADWQESFQNAIQFSEEWNLPYVHSFDDPFVVAGQSTIATEMVRQVENIDTVIAPIGGGGLISGIALGMHYRSPNTEVVGVQPSGGDSMLQSLKAGHPVMIPPFRTIADGLAARRPGDLTFAVTKRHVESVHVVDEVMIRSAMALMLREERIVMEPSSAVSLALLMHAGDVVPGQRVVCVITGCNVDPSLLAQLVSDAQAFSE